MILALDTTTRRGSVAVVTEEGAVILSRSFTSDRSHNSALFAPLKEALEAAGGKLRAVVIGTGPGSYTGARVGIAAAVGVGLIHDIPVLGRSSLFALDTGGPALWVGDARRGLWVACRLPEEAGEEIRLLSEEERDRAVRSAMEEGRRLVSVEQAFELADGTTSLLIPEAARLALPFASMGRLELRALDKGPPEPIYLQAPLVTRPS